MLVPRTPVPPRHRLFPAAALVLAIAAASAVPGVAHAQGPFNPNAISDVAEKVTPAVVNITTKKARAMASVPFDHPMFRDFFGGRESPHRRGRPQEVGAGSGVVVSPDGYIVTNNHVVEDADDILVTFADKRELTAKLIGTDKPSDIALIKVDAKGLPHLSFGNSSTLRLGEIVLAVGNPFGVGQTVTMGIVSAKGRAKMGIVDYEDFIQTDASINPGNSGGALVNLKGELVGINTAILSKSGGAQGIGFAVPSSMVEPILGQIREHGRVRRGWMGVAIQDITPELSRSMKLGESKGVLISDVMDGGPAARAKIESGDVVTKIDDKPTTSAAELRNAVALMKPGSDVKVQLLREGKKVDVTVKLAEKEDERIADARPSEGDEQLFSGMAVQDLDRELRARARVPERVRGVIVTSVEPGSAAEESGVQEGDVVVAINRREVRAVGDVAKLVDKGAKEALLRIWRQGSYVFVVLKR
ncbi:DegQ family serine endoprotease [Myxococcota bacterium]|nr:DegQ family serine endoprotease [Myxococcota bacterium]